MDRLWETPIQESNSSAHETSELCGHKTCGHWFRRPVQGTSTCYPGSDTTLLPCAHEYSTPLNTGKIIERVPVGKREGYVYAPEDNCCVVALRRTSL